MDAGTKLFTNTHSKELLFSTNSPFSKGVNILQESMMEWGQEMFFFKIWEEKTQKKIIQLAIIIIFPPSQKMV